MSRPIHQSPHGHPLIVITIRVRVVCTRWTWPSTPQRCVHVATPPTPSGRAMHSAPTSAPARLTAKRAGAGHSLGKSLTCIKNLRDTRRPHVLLSCTLLCMLYTPTPPHPTPPHPTPPHPTPPHPTPPHPTPAATATLEAHCSSRPSEAPSSKTCRSALVPPFGLLLPLVRPWTAWCDNITFGQSVSDGSRTPLPCPATAPALPAGRHCLVCP